MMMNMPMQNTPDDWYWFIGDDKTKMYSSKRCGFVDATDQEYLDWRSSGRAAPTIDSMETLEGMLAGTYPPGSLKSYNPYARFNKASAGVVVTSISPVPFLSDQASRNALANALEYIKATPGSTVNWKMSDGSFVVLNEAKLTTATTAVATFVQNCFTCESATLTGIVNGSVITIGQIDDAYAAISNVYP